MTAPRENVGSQQVLRVLTGPTLAATRARRFLVNVALYVASITVALALASVLVVLATEASPFEVTRALFEGSLSTPAAVGLTLEQAAPILIVALGSMIATRSGMFNIGPEGQFAVGSVAGGLVMFKLSGPPAVMLPLTLLGAAAGGALWAGVAAGLRAWREVDVIITTLLLNFVAIQVVSFAVNKPWLLQEVTAGEVNQAQSPRLSSNYRLPRIGELPGFSTTSGILLALALAVVVACAVGQTRWGFRLRMLGLNPTAARAAGVNLAVLGGGALVLSGAFAGLAGGVFFTGTGYRISSGSLNIGYTGLLVALISRGHILAAIPVAIAFGALDSGGGLLASTGVPSQIVDIVQALVVLAALMPPVIMHVWQRSKALRIAREEARRESTSPLEAVA